MKAGRGRAGRQDLATRLRLFEAATRLFAERGFAHVTVREICREAGANLAAINYHFGDKARLYAEVVRAALGTVRDFVDEATSAGPGTSPEDRLRHYIRAHLVHTADPAAAKRASVIRNLFRHELAEPTMALQTMLEQAIHPRIRYLREVVASLLGAGASETDVERCVVSIQAQCLSQIAMPRALGSSQPRSVGDVEALAEHFYRFSIAGVRAIAAA